MAYHTVRNEQGKYIRLDSYAKSPVPTIATAIVTILLLAGAATYALTYQVPVCPPGRTEYHGPAC
tara:strand:+ start:683 stop:877 length:195 start_codon:yes stop_codon:yes gene_type:complete